MKKGWIAGLCAIAITVQAQVPDTVRTDTLRANLPDISLADSLWSSSLSADWEYIPGDDTPELIAERLRRIEKTIGLPYNERVHGFINYFTVRDRDYTRKVMRKTNLYFPLFESALQAHGLPEELKYLSIIESGLNPRAVSRARAVGLWQFMSGTGRYFGLRNDGYLDDRMDPEKSTEAACRYLRQLYELFGDWHLALAAYNSGPGTVRKAIRRAGYQKSFWEVYPYLPRETRAYVPQFIAMVYTLHYTDEHNIFVFEREEFLPHDTLHFKGAVHFEILARHTETCLEDWQKLNPAVRLNALPSRAAGYVLKVPTHVKGQLLEQPRVFDSLTQLAHREVTRLATQLPSGYGSESFVYTVRSGDVLGKIAMQFNVSVGQIKEWNRLNGHTIYAGQKLTIYAGRIRAAAPAATVSVTPIPADAETYIVQPGDTLWDISRRRPGLSVEKLRSLNNLKSDKLQPGQKLILG